MAANQSPMSRKRAKHTRSKRGCQVCRIRRVRCDLTRPSCKRCTSTGRACEGYPMDLDSRIRTAAIPALAPSSSPHLTWQEQRHLAYFRCETAPQFGGYFEDELWSQLILQLAVSEDSIKHMLVAFGLLHEKMMSATCRVGSVESFETYVQATRSYNNAVRYLQLHLATQAWVKVEVTLIACILCVGFEWLRGEKETAWIHLRSGLKILDQSENGSRSGSDGAALSSASHRLIQDKIAPFYRRLVLQAGTIYGLNIPWPFQPHLQGNTEAFFDLEDARDSLIDIIGQMLMVPATKKLLDDGGAQSNSEHAYYMLQLVEWHDRFQQLKISARTLRSHRSNTCFADMIELLYMTAVTMLADIRETPSPSNHRLTYFRKMIDLLDKVIKNTSVYFTIDLGIVAIIFYTATSSNDSAIRAQALKLLESHQAYEGFWNSAEALKRAHIEANS